MIRTWRDVYAHYESYPGATLAGMRELVDSIQNSPYASSLYPWTSMFDLCISHTPVTHEEVVRGAPYLRISPKSNTAIEFRYIDTPNKDRQWVRTCTPDESFNRLEHFFRQIHWFVEVSDV